MHHDVGTLGDRLDQVRGGDGVVDDQRHTVLVRDTRDTGGVQHVDLGVGDRFGEERFGVRPHRAAPRLQVVGIGHEADVDTQFGQRIVEQVVGAAVEPRAGDNVVAGAGQVQDRERLGGLTGRQEQGGHTALQRGDPLFDDVGGRVADPGVDVAFNLQSEQGRGVCGVVEGVGRGLVDRQGAGFGERVRLLAGVDLFGLERPVLGRIGLGVALSAHVDAFCWKWATRRSRD